MNRSSGILLPVSALPSQYGIGCFSREAYEFTDKLSDSGQKFWQILPLGPTGYGDSPYQSFSSFAGNPYYISLDELIENGLLDAEECNGADFGSNKSRIDYGKLYENRFRLLRLAYNRSNHLSTPDYASFCEREKEWLDDYAAFMTLKEHFGGKPWNEWEDKFRFKSTDITADNSEKDFWKFVQYLFYSQWYKLKKHANSRGIKIIGDIPIYVSPDSVDVWSNLELFYLDRDRQPIAVSGCPPDGFSAKGQLWGNPLYNWEEHKKTNYRWWIKRLEHCFGLYDVVRIDHFRGFDEYYAIPFGAEDATNGKWEKGPGIELFEAIKQELGDREIIAEDLGFITDSVRELTKKCGFAGMKILEFAFDSRDTGNKNDHLPHNYVKNCVAYTATHDNQTLKSWLNGISDSELEHIRDYLCDYRTPLDELNIPLIALLMRSNADLCIIPFQDWLGLDDTARINTPSTIGNNWTWRMTDEMFSDELCGKMLKMTKLYGRFNNV